MMNTGPLSLYIIYMYMPLLGPLLHRMPGAHGDPLDRPGLGRVAEALQLDLHVTPGPLTGLESQF